MERRMFGHRNKKRSDSERVPGEPYNDRQYERGDEDEESYEYVKNKEPYQRGENNSLGKSRDAPRGYEGKEHVKYRDPGYSSHHIRYPEDEPHMKSHASREEKHEMEDNYHMRIPNQTEYSLEAKLKRARMKMDAPDQEEPDRLRGNMVHNEPYEGDEDTSGREEMGPNDMQSGMSKEHRKKMIVAIARRKMKKSGKY